MIQPNTPYFYRIADKVGSIYFFPAFSIEAYLEEVLLSLFLLVLAIVYHLEQHGSNRNKRNDTRHFTPTADCKFMPPQCFFLCHLFALISFILKICCCRGGRLSTIRLISRISSFRSARKSSTAIFISISSPSLRQQF